VVISLNGGLGTTMKLQRAKSLIPVRQGLSFLEITARQILRLREVHQVPVPLLLMNSYRTRDDTLAALAPLGLELEGLPLDFLQNKSPRIVRDTALPLELADEEPCWAPPGHGDLYLALWQTGLLEQLIERGFRWAFVSNIDNLGSTVDPRILGHLDRADLQFAMEVTDKSPADVKGGTLVRQGDRLMLLERSQVAAEHVEAFQDISVFSVFNTNSLWWRLDAMLEKLRAGALELPMIVNPKTVEGVEVIQLETAMGAAIGSFERSAGIHVPRSRFAPVKATCDLLAVRSDAYLLDEGAGIRPNPERDPSLGPPVVVLDDRFYRGLADFEQRFPSPPSMVACRSLTVEGDLRFGEDVRLEGDVVLRNPSSDEQRSVPDGARLGSGTHEFR
jgi:UTP--glucose-1-phosphate uridylyltransferase